MKHYNIQPPDIHPFSFVSDTDPADDVDNDVAAKKIWFDTTDQRLKLRNDANDDWILVGGD